MTQRIQPQIPNHRPLQRVSSLEQSQSYEKEQSLDLEQSRKDQNIGQAYNDVSEHFFNLLL